MFSTLQQKLILAVYIFLILAIPLGSYLVSELRSTKSQASQPAPEKKLSKSTESTQSAQSKLIEDIKNLQEDLEEQEEPLIPTPAASVSFGPTLDFKIIIEGRPLSRYASKIFVGIAEGDPTESPKYVLSFTIDLPDSGIFTGLSLAGLTEGNKYSTYLKGPAQIATSSAFIMSPYITNLNSGNVLTLTTGDVNEDNVINTSDYSIVKTALGTTSTSPNWNSILDFNLDNAVNTVDLAYVVKNMSKTGESGVWVSPVPNVSSSSGTLTNPPSGSPSLLPDGSPGYWVWIPKI